MTGINPYGCGMLLKRGNLKLPTSVGIWNLPAVTTCLGATPACKQFCYALKAERQYPHTTACRRRHLEYSRAPWFVAAMIHEIRHRRRHLETVRIHESGDFYSSAYFDKWLQIAEALPAVTFFAYTRTLATLNRPRPTNLILYHSLEAHAPDLAPNYTLKAYVITHGTAPLPGVRTCPGDCHHCHRCWKRPQPVQFMQH